MSRRIRLWRHEGLWRIQFYQGQIKTRYGQLQDVWKSHSLDGVLKLFGSEEEAREYMRKGVSSTDPRQRVSGQ